MDIYKKFRLGSDGDFEFVSKEELDNEMFRSSYKPNMKELLNSLPDERPITSLAVVEEISGCPPNFQVVSKTHDQDTDADLLKDGFFKRICRYLCYSKTEGFFGYVVENMIILSEKESRPVGYQCIDFTKDTNQKAFRKKQLCFKLLPRNVASQYITDIIILGRSKLAPEGFILVGEMNGLTLCYKTCRNPDQAQDASSSSPSLYPGLSDSALYPSRPAPQPPESNIPAAFPYSSPQHLGRDVDFGDTYGVTQSALYGVPFLVNEKYLEEKKTVDNRPGYTSKTPEQITNEFYYSFSLEQDILLRHSTGTL